MILRPARFVPALPHTACLVSRPLSSMASTPRNPFAPDDMESFWQHLKSSKRIIALCGAGLSASSGLPTFRGSGGLWRKYDAKDLATPDAFQADPTLVWQFYSYRRHMALKAKPNRAHYALAELARRNPNFITLTQNVDGRSTQRLPSMLLSDIRIQVSHNAPTTHQTNSCCYTEASSTSAARPSTATTTAPTSPIQSSPPSPSRPTTPTSPTSPTPARPCPISRSRISPPARPVAKASSAQGWCGSANHSPGT